jgi:hypothetical protein
MMYSGSSIMTNRMTRLSLPARITDHHAVAARYVTHLDMMAI